ncbi:MAG: FAD:protein FMN transferase [Polaromonas sp.]
MHEPPATALQRHSLSGETMGTRYTAVFFAGAGVDVSAIGAGLFAAVDRVDRQMSTWKPDSDLNRLNRAPERQWEDAPGELISVLGTALQVGQQSGGAFDINVGGLVNAWGFGAGGQAPNGALIAALERQPHRPAGELLEIDPLHQRVRKRAAVTLDLSGIAKGHGVDELARCLDAFGVDRYLVGIDGEMRARGLKPDGQAWAVAVEKPVRGVREVMGVMEITDTAIATSGDYRHSVVLNGEHHAHTMNPALGGPARNRLAAVTVLASSCMLADAWATALLVLGEEAGIELAQTRGMDALFVLRDGEGFQEISIEQGRRQFS